MCIRDRLVAFVHPIRLAGIVGDDDQFKSRMRGDGTRQVVVLYHAQHGDSKFFPQISHRLAVLLLFDHMV